MSEQSTVFWSRLRESNASIRVCNPLPGRLAKPTCLASMMGFEPTLDCLKNSGPWPLDDIDINLVSPTGFEPAYTN